MEHNVLFRTPSGSRLYGLAHAGSDYDWYTVVDKVRTTKAKYATHTIVDGVDSVVVDFGTWVNLCQSGVPQALEAMFSQQAAVDKIEDFRNDFVAGTNYDKYLRTIEALAFHEPNDMKHRRHALRLAINMQQLREFGRFNPTLDAITVKTITLQATSADSETVYREALDLAWS